MKGFLRSALRSVLSSRLLPRTDNCTPFASAKSENLAASQALLAPSMFLLVACGLLCTRAAQADSAEIVAHVGDCVADCAESATSVRISGFGIGGSVQGYSAITTSINNAGQTVFAATVTGPGVGSGILSARIIRREPDGRFTILAKPGMPVQIPVQMPASGIIGATLGTGSSLFLPSAYRALYEDGSLLLHTYISLPGNSGTTRAYVCANGTSVTALMVDGQEVPDSGGRTFVTEVTPYPHLARSGCSAAIRASEMSGTTSFGEGIWEVAAGQSPVLIGKRGAQAPGLPSGITFGQDYPRPSYANQNYRRVEYGASPAGYSMVQSYLEGDGVRRNPDGDAFPLNNAALWIRTPSGQMTLLARRGDPVPGIPGAYFDLLGARLYYAGAPGVQSWSQFQAWAVNSQGRFAFVASITDGTTDLTSTINGSSIWSNRSGALRLETRSFERFVDAATGQEWELRSTGITSNGQKGVHLDDAGTLYYSGYGYRVGIDPINLVTPARRLLIEHKIDGARRVLVWEGQSLPGFDINSIGSSFVSNFFVSNRSSVLFTSAAQYGGAAPGNGTGVFMYRNNTLRSIGRIGDTLSALGGISLDPYSVYITFQANSLGQYTWDESSTGKALVLGDDEARLKLIIDSQGNFPLNGDTRLSQSTNTCKNVASNELGDFVLSCNSGSVARLVAYHADSDSLQCVADFNHDSTVTVEDLFAFLSAWFARGAGADLNGIGGVTVQDVFDFLNAWFDGCG